jgi:hypothetical protein
MVNLSSPTPKAYGVHQRPKRANGVHQRQRLMVAEKDKELNP